MSRLLRSFSHISFRSNSSSSSSPRNSNLLSDQDNQTHEVAPKHNLFDKEVRFEDIVQNMDDWNIPEIPQDQLYVPETIKDKHNFDYIIKTVENNIPLGQDIGEEFHLLSKNSIYEHSRKYKYLHIGCVQVAIKPLIDMGIDATVLMCLRDIRHNKFEDSLIGTVETSLGQGPVYFNCYPTKTVSLMDKNILDSLFLNIHFHGLDMKEGSIPTALIYRIQYKTKDFNEEVTSKDIKSLMEQANYTNKYLQVLGETIKTKVVPKQKSTEEVSPSIPIEKPSFKPFKVSDKAKRKIRELRKTKSLIEGVGDNHSELLNKIGSLLKVIPETPQTSENTSKMVTRSTSKLINVINEDSDQDSENATEIGSVSEKNINPINSKHWKTPSKLYYQRPTAPNPLLEERGENNFNSFSANNIYEWNIDAQIEYNIMNALQHMTMVATVYQTSHECSEETIIDILVAGFSGQLKGWWDNYLTNEEKSKIYSAVKTDLNGKVITNDDDKEISDDAVNTLIFTIAQHFIGDPSLWKDRSAELLSNLKCRTLADFRWYRDTFLSRVYTREDSQQPFWKEKFLAGLPRSLGDKVRDKIRSQSANGDIPYEVASKICQDDKIQRQLAQEKAQTKKDLGSFCEQFGLLTCPKQKKKQSSKKEIHENKPVNKKRFTRRRYSHKLSTSHIIKYCRLRKNFINLNLEPEIEEQINNLLIETSEEEETEIHPPEQDLLFEAINSIPDPQENKVFLEKLKKTLEVKPRQKDFITNNTFDVSNILKRLENSSTKPTTIQDLQTEINNLKREVKEFRQQQEIHQIILSQLEEDSDSESANNSEENQPENLKNDMFVGLINKIKIQKFYINIKIIINDFVLETMALFDTGTDSNCILEGLIPTKFFEKTSEKLSTANGSKLKINFKLSNAIVENQGLRINTNFLVNISRAPQTRYLTTLPVNSYKKVVMPPKASGISLRGGRSTGKGPRQALPEPTTNKSSTSSGSSTQAGSSTQKTNLEGPSTQITSIKPESSTQEPPKSATAKQTSVDYAWTIETLQALQDMGLTKFPKIIKKSWADIASESDDDSESNLQTMIQNASMTKTATNPKGKLPLAKAQTPPAKQTKNYIYKNKFLTVLQMEPGFWDKNPFKASAKAFPSGFHYKPTIILKTRTFYELILVDSNLVSIKHFKDPKDQTLNTHSTIQILKVIQPRHFGSDLNKGKRFSVPFDPSHLAAFLAGSKSKEILTKNLKEVLQMLQQEDEGSSSKKEETSSAEEEEEDPFYQNEDDCFGICLD
ncbi:hypothetical protein JHK82_018566 [Glycine max]|uniref:DUF7746 domain-containing protein n=1 Tax=Glycine max TaxID=3847 RepID=K7L1Q1_SOYBN|nr:hypothetical protein JHK82_018566 [Glycine max]